MRAAVALMLRYRPGPPALVLIRRAANPRDYWSGHLAFPGGFRHFGDRSLLATARREVREELGYDLEKSGRLLGRLDDVAPVNRFGDFSVAVTPYVFELLGSPEFEPNEEVAEVLTPPLSHFLDPAQRSFVPHPILQDPAAQLPAWQIGDQRLWGLSYRILSKFLQRAGAESPSGEEG